MLLGIIQHLTGMIELRNSQKQCDRCGLLFKKTLPECPRCADVSDEELSGLLQHSAEARVGMGKTMFYVAATFGLLFIFINLIT